MKQNFFPLLFLFISFSAFSKEEKKELLNETYRPQFHFSPIENRMGSPISIIKSDTVYHLFYQWNPHNLQPGFVNWGYASSNDLMTWKQNGISIAQPIEVSDSMKFSPWWGSICQKGEEKFAWVDSWDEGIFRYSGFKNGVWNNREKVTGTDSLLKCEPFVFWHEKTNKWIMVAHNRGDSTVNFLNSSQGLEWKKTSSFSSKLGFVSMVELPVDRKTDDTRWLLISETGNYLLGKFDDENFVLKSPASKFDYGNLVGGSVFFTDKQNNRTILVSELKSEQHPDLPSNGQLSFPTEISLHEYSTGTKLQRQPIGEIKNLYNKTQEWANKKIYPGINNNILGSVRGETMHIKGIIDLMNCDQFGFIIRCDKNLKGTEINYNVLEKEFTLLGNNFNYKPDNNKIEFEILIDRSSIELFIEGGRYVVSSNFVPEVKSQKYLLYTIGGEIMVDQLEVHQLKSVWGKEEK